MDLRFQTLHVYCYIKLYNTHIILQFP